MNEKEPSVVKRFNDYFDTIKGRLHPIESCVKTPSCPIYVHEKITRKISKYDVGIIGHKSFVGPQTKESVVFSDACTSRRTKPKPHGVSLTQTIAYLNC